MEKKFGGQNDESPILLVLYAVKEAVVGPSTSECLVQAIQSLRESLVRVHEERGEKDC